MIKQYALGYSMELQIYTFHFHYPLPLPSEIGSWSDVSTRPGMISWIVQQCPNHVTYQEAAIQQIACRTVSEYEVLLQVLYPVSWMLSVVTIVLTSWLKKDLIWLLGFNKADIKNRHALEHQSSVLIKAVRFGREDMCTTPHHRW